MDKKEYLRNYYIENKEYAQEYKKTKYSQNAEYFRQKMRDYRREYPERSRLSGKRQIEKCLKSWDGYFPKETNCECCGRTIIYLSKKCSNSICFDHKREGLPIKSQPSMWLRSHRRTPENQVLWESCNFGMLCNTCNLAIPTANRKEWLKRITTYINKD